MTNDQNAPSPADEPWSALHAEFGLLTAQEMSLRLGVLPEDVRALYGAGNLIAVHRGGRVLYPGFQAAPTGEVRPVIADLLRAAEAAGRSQTALILWLVTPAGNLDDQRPVDLLEDPERVLTAFT